MRRYSKSLPEITFEAFGLPKPQGSKKAFKTKQGRIVLVEAAGKPHKVWREVVAEAAREVAPPELFTGPVRVEVDLFLPRAKSNNDKFPIYRNDLDKLIRSVLDSMTGIIFKDDGQVVELVASKSYSDSRADGAKICVRVLTN